MEHCMQVSVSPWLFRSVWCVIAWLYGACACFLAAQAALYYYLPIKAAPLVSALEIYSIGVAKVYYRTIASAFIAIAAVHVASLLEMLYASMRYRRLTFTAPTNAHAKPSRIRRSLTQSLHRVGASMKPILPAHTSRLHRLACFFGASLVSLWRALDVTNPNYGVVYVIRELVQTGVQTHQAYRLSALVARTWMNRVVVALLVLNCWTMPIILLSKHSSLGSTRLLCLLVNLALDFVAAIVFPVALFLPYYADFEPQGGDFSRSLWYTDVWLIQVINEWQLLFVVSLWDALTKYFIAFNIARSLRSIPRLLRCRDTGNSVGVLSSALGASTIPVGTMPNSVTAIVPAPHASPSTAASSVSCADTSTKSSSPVMDRWRHRVEHWGHRLLALWGVAVFGCHILAALSSDRDECLVQVRPWFTTRPVCSLMEISCFDGQLTGRGTDFDRAIDAIEREWLAYLIIRHCPAVEITPRVRELSWLMGVKVYNSTLLRWDQDAAFTQTHHPNLLSVFMGVIKAHAVPRGLYDPDFPLMLYDIELTQWNVTSLPDEIVDVWPPGMFLVVEMFQFTAFPEALARLRPSFLFISYNNFREIPAKLWENEGLIILSLNGNPITSLPHETPASQVLSYLFIVETQISRLPTWVHTETMIDIRAGSTPFCANVMDGYATGLGVTDSEMAVYQRVVNCTPAKDYHYLTQYPLPDEAINNPSRSQSRNRAG